MWKHDSLLISKVMDNYDDMVSRLENNVSRINTGDNSIDVNLIRSEVLEFCRSWQEFSNSYKEVKDKDLDIAMKAIEEFNSNVSSAVNLIALQRKLKDKKDRSGINAPAYKHLDIEAIKKDYISGSNIAELVNKYNISRPTLIKRLKELGVFKDGRLK